MASLPLLPEIEPRPKLVGIARIAAEGVSLREGHDVEYFTLETRSLLHRITSERNLPYTWGLNPYRGCEFSCKYCYARYTHEFMEMRDGVDFEQKIFVKQHAAELLRQELRKVKTGEEIGIGSATDPYQPAERRFEVTRAILEELARHSGLEIGIVTKSNLITRDAEILRRVAENNRLHVSVTVTTVNVELARKLEPRAPRPDLRLAAIGALTGRGIPCAVLCCPVMPLINDSARSIDKVAHAAAAAGATSFHGHLLFLKPCAARVFLPFLEEQFPHLVRRYRERFGSTAFLGGEYPEFIARRVAAARQRYGLVQHWPGYAPQAFSEEEQLTLFPLESAKSGGLTGGTGKEVKAEFIPPVQVDRDRRWCRDGC